MFAPVRSYLFENEYPIDESRLIRNQTTIDSDRSELINWHLANCRVEFKVECLKLDLDLTALGVEGGGSGGVFRFSSGAQH